MDTVVTPLLRECKVPFVSLGVSKTLCFGMVPVMRKVPEPFQAGGCLSHQHTLLVTSLYSLCSLCDICAVFLC